jgi:DNA-directed RNA polymerase subunit K/omega
MDCFPITKYEKARIIGVRATQISNGSKIKTDITGMTDPLKMAEKEFNEGTIPICIIRTLPNGQKLKISICS